MKADHKSAEKDIFTIILISNDIKNHLQLIIYSENWVCLLNFSHSLHRMIDYVKPLTDMFPRDFFWHVVKGEKEC